MWAVNGTRHQRLFHALANAESFKRWPFRRISAHQANFLHPITPTGTFEIQEASLKVIRQPDKQALANPASIQGTEHVIAKLILPRF